MARLTRHELKQDEFRSTVEQFEQFAREHARDLVLLGVALVLAAAAAAGIRRYLDRQEAEANQELGAALTTFQAQVGSTPSTDLSFNPASTNSAFPTPQAKYQKALEQFRALAQKHPRLSAGQIALYHEGLCQAALGDDAAAVQTLEKARNASDKQIASLAGLALAGELVKTGRTADAVKLYQQLADHPTNAVPRATALMALADAYRAKQPDQALLVYEKMQKEFATDSFLMAQVRQAMEGLNKQ